MQRQLLRWCCVTVVLLLAFASGLAVSGATFVVNPKKVGALSFYFSPTNVTINVGDTVVWTNMMDIHSLEPRGASTEPFCGTGTNVLSNCAITFLTAGSISYDCYQHLPTMTGSVVVLGPTAVITNPANNTLFGAPAIVNVGANASDTTGTVVSVQFLTNGVSAGTATVAPYGITLSNVAAGAYTLRARATDSVGLVTTSAPVAIRVVTPPLITAARGTNGPLQFSFNTVTGVQYVVEGSLVLTNFSPIVTNAGTGAAQLFSKTNPAPAQQFFRLRLQ